MAVEEREMKIAMPIWQGRISPVMDAATRLLVIEYVNGREVSRAEESISEMLPPQMARHLADLGISVLICGGISQPLFSLIAAQTIMVIPWITGPTEEILKAYHTNHLQAGRFAMPGCGGCRRGRGQGRGKGRGQRMGHRGMNRNTEINE